MTVTDWMTIVLSAIIIVGIVAIAILKSGRHKRTTALQRAADLREQTLRRLSPHDREHFDREWRLVEAHFIEDPRNAVAEADRVVEELLCARGCPVREWQGEKSAGAMDRNSAASAAIAVAPKPPVVQSYREAHEIVLKQARGHAHGKDLRRAMLDYRVVFDDLVAVPYTDARRQDLEEQQHDLVSARRNG